MSYTEVDIKLENTIPFSEIIIARLNEIGYDSYEENSVGLKAYILTERFNEKKILDICDDVSLQTGVSYSFSILEDKNWNEQWEKNYSPVIINDICVIRAPFHTPFKNVKYEVVIMPKMSFGTGHHATTSLILDKMFELNFSKKNILDIGSGTGILTILSSMLGANYSLGIDYDKWAFENAKQNAELNNISNINFHHGTIDSLQKKVDFDIVLVNINKNTILKEITSYIDFMSHSVDLILSGFLHDDTSVILDKLSKHNFRKVDIKNKDKWQMIHLKRY
jgi:ribosomal protein L11 methyltransferase|tara:strand:+ start:275 stop:1111 length:837 start_codon:yes stop_codon:yes gene_type:complete